MMAPGYEWTSSHTSAGREVAIVAESFSTIRSDYSRDAGALTGTGNTRRRSLLARSQVRAHALVFETPLALFRCGSAAACAMLAAFLVVWRRDVPGAAPRGRAAVCGLAKRLAWVVLVALRVAFVVAQRAFSSSLPMAAVGLASEFADWTLRSTPVLARGGSVGGGCSLPLYVRQSPAGVAGVFSGGCLQVPCCCSLSSTGLSFGGSMQEFLYRELAADRDLTQRFQVMA